MFLKIFIQFFKNRWYGRVLILDLHFIKQILEFKDINGNFIKIDQLIKF